MLKKITSAFALVLLLCQLSYAQVVTKTLENIQVEKTTAKLLGKTIPIREAIQKPTTTKEKRQHLKREKKVPDNFRGRRNQSKAIDFSKEHQGPDPVRQTQITKRLGSEIEVLANAQGRGQGSPSDPTGDVNDEFYVQAVNATDVGVYNLDGSLETSFAMNILWTQFGVSSAGDPIIVYDEINERWFLTEFTDPANILIAVSETKDPLGSYFAYNFSTPNFPDYPKYGLTPNALVVSTNEEGAFTLSQYFLDKNAMIAGEEDIAIQRLTIVGTENSEQGFYVSTPADWNGTREPYDDRPILLRINDSSWGDGAEEDQIEIYSFDIDFDDINNSQVTQTSVVTAPFDGFPCSVPGGGFSCIPQLGGGGIDGVPEVIMNVPHQRNFGTHESLVFSFVTDATDGQNVAGVRWVELRRTEDSEWFLYQEGTFAPDDGLHRFMSSIAMDENGNICLGYNVSSPDIFTGLRATGRLSSDPLGQMTFDELIIREGQSTINSGGRFSDYSQMSVAPGGKSEFWFTGEYAGPTTSITNIIGMSLARDSFDLSLRSILTPAPSSSEFGNMETVTVEIVNSGIEPISDFNVTLVLDGAVMDVATIPGPIVPDEVIEHTFTNTLDLSEINVYDIVSFVSSPLDQNPLNDTLQNIVQQLPNLDAGIIGGIAASDCVNIVQGTITLTNNGSTIITSATIGVTVNGETLDNIEYTGSLSFDQSNEFELDIQDMLTLGQNDVVFNILDLNDQSGDFDAANDILEFETEFLDPENSITISFFTDTFFAENAYTLTPQGSSEVIAEVSSFLTPTTRNDQLVCTTDTCFTLVVTDTYGDGICCGFGDGSITVFNNAGEILAFSNGEFANELTINFCTNINDCSLTADIDITQSSSETENDGVIMINAMNGIAPYQYSIDGGTNLQAGNVFDNLSPGEYTVFVTDANNICTYEEVVVVDFNTNTATHQIAGASVKVEILPNPTDGVFKINIQDLPTNENFIAINIYDIQGKLIQHRQIGKYNNVFKGTFSLYDYPAGTYLVRIMTPEANILEKVVKQ